MGKLKGLYVSHEFVPSEDGNEHLSVYFRIRKDSEIESDDITDRYEVWLNAELEADAEVSKANDRQNLSEFAWWEHKRKIAAEQTSLFRRMIMDAKAIRAGAKLQLDKYWKGRYQEPRQGVRKKKGKNESDKVKGQVEELQKKFPDKSKDELFHQAAEDSGKSYEATKRSYYYKPKKVTKRVT
ncbi:MAG: hypothetical protein WAO19_08540 [Candidatus Kryptoniota bacterium]